MSKYYNPQRKRNMYDPQKNSAKGGESFKLSRSKIDRFLECPRCFYFDRRLGVDRPPSYPYNLNSAVDALLKQEFDIYRSKGTKHPLIENYGVDARPVPHEDLDKWRDNFTGVRYLHKPTNFLIYGAIDDLWQNSKGEYIVVDYKATAKKAEVEALNESWHRGYKRQMEIYQWLLRQNSYKVSDTGYFVYCNGIADAEAFDRKLEFRVNLIPYKGKDDWVEKTVADIHKCLNKKTIPRARAGCDYCGYIKAINNHTK